MSNDTIQAHAEVCECMDKVKRWEALPDFVRNVTPYPHVCSEGLAAGVTAQP